MTIAFATTMSPRGSTVIGRVMPLAEQFTKHHQVHILLLNESKKSDNNIHLHTVGQEPFIRTKQGKTRLTGLPLIFCLLTIALKTTITLFRINPDVVIIVKSLPHNVLGVRLWLLFNKNKKIILDVDDFELTANVLTSINQRAAIHWAERVGADLADVVVAASPFLKDHFEQLTQNKKKVVMIPTGISATTKQRVARREDPSLLYIGSLSISSGHRIDILPDIFTLVQKTYPDAQLHIAGSGDDTMRLKRQFTKQELKHVHWHGRFATSAQIEDILQRITIILDPVDASIANRAKSSFRTTLAAAHGLPVVTSDVGIRPYLLPPPLHDRFFAKPANPKAYAEKIISLLQKPLTATEQCSLLDHAEQYTWQTLASNYDKLL